MKYPIEVQTELFGQLIEMGRETEFGIEYDFRKIKNINEYREAVPIFRYEDLYPYIEKVLRGQQRVLWPSEIRWFAKSSGTTNAKSKFIPVSQEAIDDCHFKGGKDLMALFARNFPDNQMFTGKSLVIGGSDQINQLDSSDKSYYGDVSAVIMRNLPIWAQLKKTPSLDIALMDDWEEKIEKMAQYTIKDDVCHIVGVPTWTVVLLERILEITGKENILEVWPNLEVFFHGAVSFTPYRSMFNKLIPSDQMHYMESYNASEGFFGIQDLPDSGDLLLMLDYGVFYEFIPFENIEDENPETVLLDDVEVGKTYALVISTNAGLWRYLIGDTVKIMSKYPFRIKIVGRTKHFINAFGEELMIENAESAIAVACSQTGAIIDNFTAAPIFLQQGKKGGHEWVIEFTKEPGSLDEFTKTLDRSLKDLNSDYEAKRYGDIALQEPVIRKVPRGTFYNWMKKRGKLGGQHKVPRLSNDREYIDDLLQGIAVN